MKWLRGADQLTDRYYEERVDRKEGTQVSVLKQPQPDKSKHRTYWELLA